MRILAVIDTLGYGGAERLLVSLLPELKKKNIYCALAVASPPYSLLAELKEAGIDVYCLDIRHPWSFLKASARLARICKKEKIDIVWGHLYFGNLYAGLARLFYWRLRVVWTLHYKFPNQKNLKQHIMLSLERLVLKYFVSSRVAVSQAVLDSYQEASKDNLICIYNGVPIANLPGPLKAERRAIVRNLFSVNTNDFLIVVPARYVAVKGHLVLCEALSILSNKYEWHPICVAAGSGGLKLAIQQRIDELNLTVTFRLLDSLPQADLFDLMQVADVVAMPSLVEPFGIAAAEAMALGIPTVLTNVDGFKELVGDSQSALMVPVNDAAALAEALWILHRNDDLRDVLSNVGKNRMQENFDTSVVVQYWVNLFMKIN